MLPLCFVFPCLEVGLRGTTQTVKRAADNKTAPCSTEGIASFCCREIKRGQHPFWHTTLHAKCNVLYLCRRCRENAVAAGEGIFTAGKQGCLRGWNATRGGPSRLDSQRGETKLPDKREFYKSWTYIFRLLPLLYLATVMIETRTITVLAAMVPAHVIVMVPNKGDNALNIVWKSKNTNTWPFPDIL